MDLFGEFLIKKGVATDLEVYEALTIQLSTILPIGRLALNEGKLTVNQILEILNKQAKDSECLFGDIAIDMGYLTSKDVSYLLKIKKESVKPIGEILVDLGVLKRELVIQLLIEFKE